MILSIGRPFDADGTREIVIVADGVTVANAYGTVDDHGSYALKSAPTQEDFRRIAAALEATCPSALATAGRDDIDIDLD